MSPKPYIVLANPSRKDLDAGELLSGYPERMIDERLRQYGISISDCSVVTLAEFEKTLLDLEGLTILFLGKECLKNTIIFGDRYIDYNLSEIRGTPLVNRLGHNCIVSYLPQDTLDKQDYEGRLNPLLLSDDDSESDSDEEESDDSASAKKRGGKTNRKNWKFWLLEDVGKFGRMVSKPNYCESWKRAGYNHRVFPSPIELKRVFESDLHSPICIDIENDPETQVISVISVAINADTVYTIPFLDHKYENPYGADLVSILQILVHELNSRVVIAHNCMHDLTVLALKYKVPSGRNGVFDTMLAHSRMFVDTEKSLGHAMSHLTHLPYHKDQFAYVGYTPEQCEKVWRYNADDVFGTWMVYEEMRERLKSNEAISRSVDQANSLVIPFITMTLTGLNYDKEETGRIRDSNDFIMDRYNECITFLVGEDSTKRIRGKSKSCLASSSRQAVKYFHDTLNYKVVARSQKTKEPKLDEKALWKLKLKYPNNAVIDFIIAYREKAKETEMLGFEGFNL